MLASASLVEQATNNSKCDTLAGIREYPDGLVLALADGGSCHGFGFAASQMFVSRMLDLSPSITRQADALLGEFYASDMDIRLVGGGDASGIVAIVRDGMVHGASAGSCEAWHMAGPNAVPTRLTEGQRRKPRLGDGAEPAGFRPIPLGSGILLLGTPGLFEWLPTVRISDVLGDADRASVPRKLREAVLDANGGYLPMDLSLVVAWDAGDA